jgi:LacI family transcriptional regulator, repressor for deo operon, udp, cdd, tsx, nupC, and nupG
LQSVPCQPGVIDARDGADAVSATIEDVARRAEVSVATVSRALRGLPNVATATRERVLAAAYELDYLADPHAARLAGGRNMTVGLIVPSLGSWYHSTLFAAVERAIGEEGYGLRPYTLEGPGGVERLLVDLPFRKEVDALLVVDVLQGPDELERIADAKLPMLTIGAWTPFAPSLTVDNVAAARTAVGHLVGLGHQRIAMIGVEKGEPFPLAAPADRHRGYVEALRTAGLVVDPRLTVAGPKTLDGGAVAMHQLLALADPPTALFACSDEMAIGAMQVARDAGFEIPAGLSVVGFDDHDVAEHVGLTTIRQDLDELGERAGRRLLALLEEGEAVPVPPERTILPTRLVVRRSTAPPRPDVAPYRPARPPSDERTP